VEEEEEEEGEVELCDSKYAVSGDLSTPQGSENNL
jgi:hypothetical protein